MKVICPTCEEIRVIKKRPISGNCHRCARKLSESTGFQQWLDKMGYGHRDGTKKCTICKEWKVLSNFPNDQSRGDKLNPFCRQCNTIKMRSYRERNRERINRIVYKSMLNHPLEVKARGISKYLYHDTQVCSIHECDNRGERHHPDYNKPSEIIWLCKKHHKS